MARILLAEDDLAMTNFITLALKSAGHTVTATNNGADALKIAHRHFDLLITDMVMPEMDGIELAKNIVKILPNIKIMFITGFAAMSAKHDCDNDIKNKKLLSKPFHLNDLVENVEKILQNIA